MPLPARPCLPFLTLAALTVAACGPSGDATDGATDTLEDTRTPDSDTVADPPDTDPVDTDPADTDPPPTATLSGRVVDHEGNPYPDAQVRLCRSRCVRITPAKDGTWSESGLEVGEHGLHVGPYNDNHVTYPAGLIALQADSPRDVGDLIVRPWDLAVSFDTAPADFDDGVLHLIGTPNKAFPETGYGVPGTRVVSMTRLPLDAPGLPLDGLAEPVLAAWSLGAFDAYLKPGWSLEVSETLGATGPVNVWYLDNNGHTWQSAGTLVPTPASAPTSLQPDGAIQLGFLTTVVLTAAAAP